MTEDHLSAQGDRSELCACNLKKYFFLSHSPELLKFMLEKFIFTVYFEESTQVRVWSSMEKNHLEKRFF